MKKKGHAARRKHLLDQLQHGQKVLRDKTKRPKKSATRKPKKKASKKSGAKRPTLPRRFTSKAKALHFARRMRAFGHHVTVGVNSKSKKPGTLRWIVKRGKAPARRDWPGHKPEHAQAAAYGWKKTIKTGKVRRPTYAGPRTPMRKKSAKLKRRR